MSTSSNEEKHKNDIYGNIDKRQADQDVAPPIPAATVVLLRDRESGTEVLMLHKNARIDFGGMWVFPGGRIDAEDYPDDGDVNAAARAAATRETREEAGIDAPSEGFVWFAHWTPPPTTAKRYATWFFAARAETDQPIIIDGGEIQDHAWVAPADALALHAEGKIDLAPPTWVTLYHLSRYSPVDAILAHFKSQPHKVYQTRAVKRSDGVRVALWHGDAGYEEWNADLDGPRHRLVMAADGFDFENTIEEY